MERLGYRNDIILNMEKRYSRKPEYLWKRYPGYAVFRHEDNQKWFAVIMDVRRSRLGLFGDDPVDIINVKVSDLMYRDFLLQQEGFLPGYHMSKGNWISVLLDGTVSLETILTLIDTSFQATASAQKKH